jgi:PTH1 family peptidyl-tRNA hydrolase
MGGGHAGHNGLRSIFQHLGTPDFMRLRVGIGRPRPGTTREVHGWVLSTFDAVERAELPDVLARATAAIRAVAKDGLAAATKALHTKP